MGDGMKIFGDVISVYTRAQAIADGVLIDLSEHPDAQKCYKHPVAFTNPLWCEITRGAGQDETTRDARIWDILYMSTAGTAKIEGSDSFFPVIVGSRTLKLRANCGPGDDWKPVITIGFPADFSNRGVTASGTRMVSGSGERLCTRPSGTASTRSPRPEARERCGIGSGSDGTPEAR
jgi:hypothetical protein